MNNDLMPRLLISLLLLCLVAVPSLAEPAPARLPDGFTYCESVIPDIRTDLRYATTHNFVGDRIEGYRQPRCILTRKAALALRDVQDELRPFGLGLKVFDAYRPQRAVDHFVRWAHNLTDTRMKAEFYPGVEKAHLFRDDYIAARSGHSRGSTVDVTIVSLRGGTELDMGTGFDFFGPESWPACPAMTAQARANRLLLQGVMKRHGFRPYAREWWHFTLETEPFPTTYFDVPVE
ncbi:MAG TPA: M15 family metallopeptidase [Desulfuromonadaceae bacterium]